MVAELVMVEMCRKPSVGTGRCTLISVRDSCTGFQGAGGGGRRVGEGVQEREVSCTPDPKPLMQFVVEQGESVITRLMLPDAITTRCGGGVPLEPDLELRVHYD